MTVAVRQCMLHLQDEHHTLEDYEGGVPRWCNGCGDNAILAAVQRLCRSEDLSPDPGNPVASSVMHAMPLAW